MGIVHEWTSNRVNYSKVHIGMSVLKIRPRTLENIRKLHNIALNSKHVKVSIFNKTQENFAGFSGLPNFEIIKRDYEGLYATMALLDLTGCSHVWWVNDDDYFAVTDLKSLESFKDGVLYLPKMKVVGEFTNNTIDWADLISQDNASNMYLAYWRIGAPLVFSVLPVFTFSSWVSFVEKDPFQLPHLDTQLNLLASLVVKKESTDHFEYQYGTENWEDSESVSVSAKNYALAQSLNSSYIFTMNLVRNIENICIVNHHYRIMKESVPEDLMATLLNQFGPYQNGGRAFVIKNFLPRWIRSRIILTGMPDEFKCFIRRHPDPARSFLLGSVNFRTSQQVKFFLDNFNVFSALLVPDAKKEFWDGELTA